MKKFGAGTIFSKACAPLCAAFNSGASGPLVLDGCKTHGRALRPAQPTLKVKRTQIDAADSNKLRSENTRLWAELPSGKGLRYRRQSSESGTMRSRVPRTQDTVRDTEEVYRKTDEGGGQ